MKTILLMDIVIVFVGIYLAVSAAKMKKSGQISDLVFHFPPQFLFLGTVYHF